MRVLADVGPSWETSWRRKGRIDLANGDPSWSPRRRGRSLVALQCFEETGRPTWGHSFGLLISTHPEMEAL